MVENPDISDMKSADNDAIRPAASPNESDYRKVRARQVGRLMLSYRLERKGRGRGGRLSQKGLLDLMGRVKGGGGYEDYSHSTVGRWLASASRSRALPTNSGCQGVLAENRCGLAV